MAGFACWKPLLHCQNCVKSCCTSAQMILHVRHYSIFQITWLNVFRIQTHHSIHKQLSSLFLGKQIESHDHANIFTENVRHDGLVEWGQILSANSRVIRHTGVYNCSYTEEQYLSWSYDSSFLRKVNISGLSYEMLNECHRCVVHTSEVTLYQYYNTFLICGTKPSLTMIWLHFYSKNGGLFF